MPTRSPLVPPQPLAFENAFDDQASPMLMQPTPLGRWADACWSRQTSEFIEENKENVPELPTEQVAQTHTASPPKYCHNPYTCVIVEDETTQELYQPALYISEPATNNFSYEQGHYADASRYDGHFAAHSYDEFTPSNSGHLSGMMESNASSAVYDVDHHTQPMYLPPALQQAQQHMVISSFMPPAPPPEISERVFYENGDANAEATYYHMVMRWYHKVTQVQHFFLPEEGFCPVPEMSALTFYQWCNAIHSWWMFNFENAQCGRTKKFRRC